MSDPTSSPPVTCALCPVCKTKTIKNEPATTLPSPPPTNPSATEAPAPPFDTKLDSILQWSSQVPAGPPPSSEPYSPSLAQLDEHLVEQIDLLTSKPSPRSQVRSSTTVQPVLGNDIIAMLESAKAFLKTVKREASVESQSEEDVLFHSRKRAKYWTHILE
ncbi:hypothetical protein HDU79_002382 [Rhizoclosmatium sp. JEL0117]|nr:hypothetical protein HDU79_002382 [Rhizoclosmatium sp. JEL0117]